MSDVPQISPQLKGSQVQVDTSKQMFSLLDDLTAGFRSALQSAEDKQKQEASLASPAKKTAPEDSKLENSANEESEPSEVISPPEKNMQAPQEPQVAEALPEIDTEETSILEPTTDPQESPVSLAGEGDTEVKDSEDLSFPKKETDETNLSSIPEPSVEKAINAVPQTPPKEAPLSPESAAGNEVLAEEKPMTSDTADKIPQKTPSKPKAALTQSPQVKDSNQLETVTELPEQKPTADVESLNEAKHFHSIEPESQPIEVFLPKDEALKLQKGLSEIAAQSQIQPPQAEKISTRVLEGLKSVNQKMATEISKPLESRASTHIRAPNTALPSLDTHTRASSKVTAESEATEGDAKLAQKLDKLKAKVMEQVRFKVKMALKGKLGKIHVQLKPKFLGNVRIEIDVEDSSLRAHFLVDNQSVKDLLTRNSPTLQQSLQEQGIDLNELEVDVTDDQGENREGGKAFASTEEQEAVREWLASFHRFDGSADAAVSAEKEVQANGPAESAQSLNVVV